MKTKAMHPMFGSSKPFLRWWWFSGPVSEKEIESQLEWISKSGFGGVEIAWVYPLPGTTEGPEFLDAEWKSLVRYTASRCNSMGLGCDFTFGTLWPFGGSFVDATDASKTFSGLSKQRLTRSWESRYINTPSFVLDHLSKKSIASYSNHLLENGFREFASIISTSFFCDSWEVDPDQLSSADFVDDFKSAYGYDISLYTAKLDCYPDIRFDYRRLLSDKVLTEFYTYFTDICHDAGALARVQCHGAPTDILAAYAAVDIPESETLLFDPDFSLFASSAAALRGKAVTSSETFSCTYGWVPRPGEPPYSGKEEVEDLRCLADAQFANGINQVVWHGKPFSTPEKPHRFYASVHVGEDGSLGSRLTVFNGYLTRISGILKSGATYSRMAIYMPIEDQWMAGELPEELRKPSSQFYWEFQECKIPEQLLPWRPLWISGAFLSELKVTNGRICNAFQEFEVLYIDAEWMIFEHLVELSRLLDSNANILMKREPKEPGKIKHTDYDFLVRKFKLKTHVDADTIPRILSSEKPLDFWIRYDENRYILFIAHPGMRGLRYPLPYGYWRTLDAEKMTATAVLDGHRYVLDLEFKKAASLIVTVDRKKRTATVSDAGEV